MKKWMFVVALFAAAPLHAGSIGYAVEPRGQSLVQANSADSVKAVSEINLLLSQQGVSVSASATPYEKVQALFDAAKGQLPSKVELTGQIAGIGFDKNGGESVVIKGVLAGMEVAEVPGGGPIFDRVFKLVLEWNTNLIADVEGKSLYFSVPEFGKEGISFKNTPRYYEVRKSGSYLVLKGEARQGDQIVDTAYAYFYEKLGSK